VTRLADEARAGRATRRELNGSLGALGGIVSTPIINAPFERQMLRDGEVVARKTTNL